MIRLIAPIATSMAWFKTQSNVESSVIITILHTQLNLKDQTYRVKRNTTKESISKLGSHKYRATKIIDTSSNRTNIIYTYVCYYHPILFIVVFVICDS